MPSGKAPVALLPTLPAQEEGHAVGHAERWPSSGSSAGGPPAGLPRDPSTISARGVVR